MNPGKILWLTMLLLVPAARAQNADLLQQGLTYLEQGHYRPAIQALQQAATAGPAPQQWPELAAALGDAYLLSNDKDRAEGYLLCATGTQNGWRQWHGAQDYQASCAAGGKPAPNDNGYIDAENYAVCAQAAQNGNALLRAHAANNLATLYAEQSDAEGMKRFLAQAGHDAHGDVAMQLGIQLNRAQSQSPAERWNSLQTLLPPIQALPDGPEKVRYLLNLAGQSLGINPVRTVEPRFEESMALALRALQAAQHTAAKVPEDSARLNAEILDLRSDVYEQAQNFPLALADTRAAIAWAETLDAGDLLYRLHWREGRIRLRQGDSAAALTAYQWAVDALESIRIDIPVTNNAKKKPKSPLYSGSLLPCLLPNADAQCLKNAQIGWSSDPAQQYPDGLYRDLADLLLQQAARHPAGSDAEQSLLRRALKTLESIKRNEMETYLGGRCATFSDQPSAWQNLASPEKTRGQAAHESAQNPVSNTTALLYPVILEDRLELLLSVDGRIERRTVAVTGQDITRAAVNWAMTLAGMAESYELTAGGASCTTGQPPPFNDDDFKKTAEQFYRWLLEPWAAKSIQTLVVVPDGALRLLPMAALYDGRQYAVEKYAVATTPGLSLLGAQKPTIGEAGALWVGLSKPDMAVIGELKLEVLKQVLRQYSQKFKSTIPEPVGGAAKPPLPLGEGRGEGIKNPPPAGSWVPFGTGNALEPFPAKVLALQDKQMFLQEPGVQSALRAALALPGVAQELEALNKPGRDTLLLDDQFNESQFSTLLSNRSFSVVHIASHGEFGASAAESYLMTHDKLLHLNTLESLLKTEQPGNRRLALLTFSACKTAQGDERAPLGFSGMAIKARADSAVGSLWSIADCAAPTLMHAFYQAMQRGDTGKAQALRQAQLQLLQNPATRHPFFWAPYVLVGDWQ